MSLLKFIKNLFCQHKSRKIQVKGVTISVSEKNKEDYISLTDMVTGFEGGNSLIEKWIRNKNTIEFLAVWENMHNENFNSPEFEGIKTEAGQIDKPKYELKLNIFKQ